ncbi:MAG TPA: thiamine-phosphate kinase [Pedococcus sp.]|nr:thiamine-phosphate kinase [Pedococcus sp.]
MITPAQTLGGVSEEGLLGSIFPFFTPQPGLLVGPGDDAAVVAASGPVVATTDAMVRGRDWLDHWSSASDVGAKLLTQNLADLAAMGAVGTSVLITLVADPATPVAWARDFAKAVGEGAALAGVAVAGGDLSSAPPGVLLVSITALGDLQGRAPVLRSGARPGHTVAVRGTLGRSAAGLRLLEAGGDRATDGNRAAHGEQGGIRQLCLDHHRRPTAPLAAGPQAAVAGASAMLDVSDGLLRDGGRIARASGVCLDLEGAAIAADVAALAPLLGEAAALDCVLAGGEEHSLLATFPSAVLPPGWRALGTVREGEGISLDGRAQRPRGWDHFAGDEPGDD